MSEETTTRATARARLEQSRSALEAALGNVDQAALTSFMVTPEWNGLHILRHMLGWDALAVRCLDDWHGSRAGMDTLHNDEDTNNAALQKQMEHLSASDTYRHLNAAYDRMAAVLDRASDAELAELGEAPWGGQITRLDLIDGSCSHDAEHVAEIASARGEISYI